MTYNYYDLLVHLIEMLNSVIKEEQDKYSMDKQFVYFRKEDNNVGHLALTIVRHDVNKLRMRKDFSVSLADDIAKVETDAMDDVSKAIIYAAFMNGVMKTTMVLTENTPQ